MHDSKGKEILNFGGQHVKSMKERGQAAVEAGIKAGNINISGAEAELMELSSISKESVQRNEELKRKIASTRRAREVTIPTQDIKVKRLLRKLGHPICLFGEMAPERRERLREVVAQNPDAEIMDLGGRKKVRMDEEEGESRKVDTYSSGGKTLKLFRESLLKDSIQRANQRLTKQKEFYEQMTNSEDAALKEQEHFVQLLSKLKKFENNISEVGDIRPLSTCCFSPDDSLVLTGSWSGECRLWKPSGGKHIFNIKAHEDRISDAVFHPMVRGGSGSGWDNNALSIATASVDRTIKLWSMEGLDMNMDMDMNMNMNMDVDRTSNVKSESESAMDVEAPSTTTSGPTSDTTNNSSVAIVRKPLATLEGHNDRLSKIVFHPKGQHIISSSFDETWRVWDIETTQEVLIQDGHSSGVYGIAVHPDGALVATGDLGGIGHVWDMRSGKIAMPLYGHVKKILTIDFADNGYMLASGSEDNTAKVWDMRAQKPLHTIAAHHKSITSVQFQPRSCRFLLTASHDSTLRLWNTVDAAPVCMLSGHSYLVSAARIASDSTSIVSASLDRTWKLWSLDI